MQGLIDAAEYGQPGDDWWPNKFIMDRITAAAQYGYWAPPEVNPDESVSPFRFLRALLPVLHAEIWQWRSSPASALNQIGLCLDVVCKAKCSQSEAEKNTIEYLKEVRTRLFKFSRRATFQTPDEPGFAQLQNGFLTLDLGVLQTIGMSGTPLGTAVNNAAGSGGPLTTPGSDQDLCLWNGIASCRNKKCQLAHGPCPFCHGARCQNKPGYISFHLAELKKPRKIVLEGDAASGSGGVEQDQRKRGYADADADPRWRYPEGDRKRHRGPG